MALARRMRHNSDASRSIRSGYHRGSMLELREATTTVSAVNPCRTAFRRDRRLPASVFGPVLPIALPRLASIFRNDVIGLCSHRPFCTPSSPHRCLDQGSVPTGPCWDASVAVADLLRGVAVPLTRVCCHNLSATCTGSMESLPHHAASSPWR